MKKTLYLFLFFCLAYQTNAFSKAYFAPKDEIIERADIIAIVYITKTEKAAQKGHSWTYSKKATGQVLEVIKGNLPKKVDLYGGEDFICAQNNFIEGKFLMFLRFDKDLL